MAVSVTVDSPLAQQLSNVVQPKLVEVGWDVGGLDDSALAEYIILMLVNGKTQEQIAAELSNDLLNLGPEDSGQAVDFSRWLFEQVEILSKQGETPTQNVIGVQQPPAQPIPSFTEPQNGRLTRQGSRQSNGESHQDAEMGEAMEGVQDGSIPTGPKSMRNSGRSGNKRILNQLSKAMDRSNDGVLHRVRPQQGTERISMHNGQPPRGPRSDGSRNRAFNGGVPTGPAISRTQNRGAGAAMMQMTQQQQMALLAMYEQQAQMMSQILGTPPMPNMMMPGMHMPAINPAFQNGVPPQPQQPGRSLFDRIEHRPNHNQRMNGNFSKQRPAQNGGTHLNNVQQDHEMGDIDPSSSMEIEHSQPNKMEQSPDTVCRFNLKCTKVDCIFAHQSPAAPPNTTIDLESNCEFGAACKNRKCVGRHPSPAQKATHQSEQECKFYPNCTKENCPFKHPTMPMCRNGADCNKDGCKFTHVRTKCKFNPCLNPNCVYKHEEGQKRGAYDDKVWTADGSQDREHVSERKFVVGDEHGEEELIVPENQEVETGT